MNLIHDVCYFFGGALLTNALPHFVSGMMGRPFQSPFAKPPGEGLSSSTVNVLWGFGNLVGAYLLTCRVADATLQPLDHLLAFGSGMLILGLWMARHFGRFHGGNTPASNARTSP